MLKLLAIVVATIIILFVLGYFLFRQTPEKIYARAMRFHKKGEECYLSKDFELAEEYYQKAENLRQRARELEKGVTK